MPFRAAKIALAGLLGSTAWTAVAAEASEEEQTRDIVVTASGYEQRIAEAPASISVLTREDLETRPFTTLRDAGINFTINDNLSLRAAVLNIADKIVPVDERGRFDGLDGNWMLDEGRRFWGSATISF